MGKNRVNNNAYIDLYFVQIKAIFNVFKHLIISLFIWLKLIVINVFWRIYIALYQKWIKIICYYVKEIHSFFGFYELKILKLIYKNCLILFSIELEVSIEHQFNPDVNLYDKTADYCGVEYGIYWLSKSHIAFTYWI